MRLNPNLNNGQWYHTDDYSSPRLSRPSLGNFLYRVIKIGGYIGSIYPVNPTYERSPIIFSVYITPEMRDKLETQFEYRFKDPPMITLN